MLNRVEIIGNVGNDPEIRAMQSGDRVANLSIATSERWTDKNSGEKREKTEWHRVVIFNQNLVDLIEKYVKKGSKLFLQGSLCTRKWEDQSGVERYATEIVLKPYNGEILLLDKKGSGVPPVEDADSYGSTKPVNQEQPVNEMEDEIPF